VILANAQTFDSAPKTSAAAQAPTLAISADSFREASDK
jgi:hypothetical protein